MRYEWDERKNLENQRKHGISFDLAVLVFEDENRLIMPDWIDESGEQRWHAIAPQRRRPVAGDPVRSAAFPLSRVSVWLWSSFMCIERITMAKRVSASSARERLVSVTSEDIRNRNWTEAEKEMVRRLAKRQAAGDDSAIDYSDIPPLTDEQLPHMVRIRDVRRKVPVSVRLDPRVLEWLKGKGEGHLTRINDILMNLMEAERRAGSRR